MMASTHDNRAEFVTDKDVTKQILEEIDKLLERFHIPYDDFILHQAQGMLMDAENQDHPVVKDLLENNAKLLEHVSFNLYASWK